MNKKECIRVEKIDHVGIRVREEKRALLFYSALGFSIASRATNDPVVIIKNQLGVELNIIVNANNRDNKNILMDEDIKYPGHTHIALCVSSITDCISALTSNGIQITQGPVKFDEEGHVSVFIRDPDLNVIELRGREENLDDIGDLKFYDPKN
ncbi:MAG: glyoxalase [Rhodospirillaceae bacterium]|nr:glyoxalase [Rhodospirillaceae bacterium]|tara:strand:- start:1733 stop:2191 length:459 start_codon:yes stop_codon:yes gene_type:complete